MEKIIALLWSAAAQEKNNLHDAVGRATDLDIIRQKIDSPGGIVRKEQLVFTIENRGLQFTLTGVGEGLRITIKSVAESPAAPAEPFDAQGKPPAAAPIVPPAGQAAAPIADNPPQCVIGSTKLKRRKKRRDGTWSDDWEDVPIKDIKSGDVILSLNEANGKLVPAVVEKLLDKGVQKVWRLVTRSGKVIETTGEHPYLVNLASTMPAPRITHKTVFEVDLSPRIEQMGVDSVVAVANEYSSVAIRISSKEKRAWKKQFVRRPAVFAPTLYGHAIMQGIEELGDRITQVVIDTDYVGYDRLIATMIGERFPKLSLRFQRIGKESRAHEVAYKMRKGNSKKVRGPGQFDPQRVLGFRVVTPGVDTWIRNPQSLFTTKDSTTIWQKVKYIKSGMVIATINGWEKVSTIYEVGRKHVYDVQIAGTHNFVGNGIVAHNTSPGGLGTGTGPAISAALAQYDTLVATARRLEIPLPTPPDRSNVKEVEAGRDALSRLTVEMTKTIAKARTEYDRLAKQLKKANPSLSLAPLPLDATLSVINTGIKNLGDQLNLALAQSIKPPAPLKPPVPAGNLDVELDISALQKLRQDSRYSDSGIWSDDRLRVAAMGAEIYRVIYNQASEGLKTSLRDPSVIQAFSGVRPIVSLAFEWQEGGMLTKLARKILPEQLKGTSYGFSDETVQELQQILVNISGGRLRLERVDYTKVPYKGQYAYELMNGNALEVIRNENQDLFPAKDSTRVIDWLVEHPEEWPGSPGGDDQQAFLREVRYGVVSGFPKKASEIYASNATAPIDWVRTLVSFPAKVLRGDYELVRTIPRVAPLRSEETAKLGKEAALPFIQYSQEDIVWLGQAKSMLDWFRGQVGEREVPLLIPPAQPIVPPVPPVAPKPLAAAPVAAVPSVSLLQNLQDRFRPWYARLPWVASSRNARIAQEEVARLNSLYVVNTRIIEQAADRIEEGGEASDYVVDLLSQNVPNIGFTKEGIARWAGQKSVEILQNAESEVKRREAVRLDGELRQKAITRGLTETDYQLYLAKIIRPAVIDFLFFVDKQDPEELKNQAIDKVRRSDVYEEYVTYFPTHAIDKDVDALLGDLAPQVKLLGDARKAIPESRLLARIRSVFSLDTSKQLVRDVYVGWQYRVDADVFTAWIDRQTAGLLAQAGESPLVAEDNRRFGSSSEDQALEFSPAPFVPLPVQETVYETVLDVLPKLPFMGDANRAAQAVEDAIADRLARVREQRREEQLFLPAPRKEMTRLSFLEEVAPLSEISTPVTLTLEVDEGGGKSAYTWSFKSGGQVIRAKTGAKQEILDHLGNLSLGARIELSVRTTGAPERVFAGVYRMNTDGVLLPEEPFTEVTQKDLEDRIATQKQEEAIAAIVGTALNEAIKKQETNTLRTAIVKELNILVRPQLIALFVGNPAAEGDTVIFRAEAEVARLQTFSEWQKVDPHASTAYLIPRSLAADIRDQVQHLEQTRSTQIPDSRRAGATISREDAVKRQISERPSESENIIRNQFYDPLIVKDQDVFDAWVKARGEKWTRGFIPAAPATPSTPTFPPWMQKIAERTREPRDFEANVQPPVQNPDGSFDITWTGRFGDKNEYFIVPADGFTGALPQSLQTLRIVRIDGAEYLFGR